MFSRIKKLYVPKVLHMPLPAVFIAVIKTEHFFFYSDFLFAGSTNDSVDIRQASVEADKILEICWSHSVPVAL